MAAEAFAIHVLAEDQQELSPTALQKLGRIDLQAWKPVGGSVRCSTADPLQQLLPVQY